ncbi:uncharacterized protein MONBRDRAFT_36813 [Monosiga brevicollis MX1]|uniref:Uncharacterized protein n=1 Tax=Monosiga brevicollis TaxID=81824 RepID=A9UXY2_MONBE|nr:uncharacterized protein MONBRDRAFT_36813 [Monosiga brevicollis MX1]EDQ89765.1 predicted protein [Monosiga brevicollis MX1]|eukprot:XP_001745187.1 hypothetical protein [Monosiga brevicollis MX1]
MGQGTSTIFLSNQTNEVVKISGQLIAKKDGFYEKTGEVANTVVPARGSGQMVGTRSNQYFKLRYEMLFVLESGACARCSVNVPPKNIIYTLEITPSHVRLRDDKILASFVSESGATPALLSPDSEAAHSGFYSDEEEEDATSEDLGPLQPVAQDRLPKDKTVILTSQASHKDLRILDGGRVDGRGTGGTYARFVVDPSPAGFLRLRSAHNPNRFLALKGGQLTSGHGGKFCELQAMQYANGLVILRSLDGAQGVGVDAKGNACLPHEVTQTGSALFQLKLVKDEATRTGHSSSEPKVIGLNGRLDKVVHLTGKLPNGRCITAVHGDGAKIQTGHGQLRVLHSAGGAGRGLLKPIVDATSVEMVATFSKTHNPR